MIRLSACLGAAKCSIAKSIAAADRGAAEERARRGEDRRGDTAGVLLVADHGPVDDDLLVVVARPFDKGDGDRGAWGRRDRLQHARIGQRRGVAFALQIEFAVVDAARHVGGEDHLEIDPGGAHLAAREDEDQECHGGESGFSSAFSHSTRSRISRGPTPRKGFATPVEPCSGFAAFCDQRRRATEVFVRSPGRIEVSDRGSRLAKRMVAAVGVFAILLQAILFGWHHHPLPFSGHAAAVVAAAATGGQTPTEADDDCPICFALAHHSAAPLNLDLSAPLPGDHLVAFFAARAAAPTERAPYLLFQSRAPPRA